MMRCQFRFNSLLSFHSHFSSTQAADGPIDALKSRSDVQKEPYNLPPGYAPRLPPSSTLKNKQQTTSRRTHTFRLPLTPYHFYPYPYCRFEWCTCDISQEDQIKEIYELLSHHYVEDDDNMFRFAYSREFLKWALAPPGFLDEWHTGVRVTGSGKLVAFISAIPATMKVDDKSVKMVEINFLCVHKKLRQKRLAPVLIREITRRVNLLGIWQAVYTAGVLLPKPVTEGQYWHRSLNPKKLVSVGFSQLNQRMTMARTIKLYKLPDTPTIEGVRPMRDDDVPAVTKLLSGYLKNFRLYPEMTEDDVRHWMVSRPGVIHSYVVDAGDEGGGVTDVFSFYTIPSLVLGNPTYNDLTVAYMFYTVPGANEYKELLHNALIMAHATGHDVFNALDIFENKDLMKELKFGIGDGKLRYYLYNWRVGREMKPEECGLIML